MELDGKVALITGAGQGAGKAIALRFAIEGAHIAVNDINAENAETTAAEIRNLGRRALALQANVSQQEEVNHMVERIIAELGGIDILVNNAGIGNTRLLEDMTDDEWHHVLGVNLDGTFFCSKAVLPTMKSRGGGKIINISSLAAKKITASACIAYTTSKAAILGFTRHLSFEVAPHKINVNCICPAWILTPKLRLPPEQVENIKNRIPLRDMVQPEDIASAALFLATDMSRMITGTTLDIDGGSSVANQDWNSYVQTKKEAARQRDLAQQTST